MSRLTKILPSFLSCSVARKTPRDSNMELLRVVAMSMIVAGHLLTHGLHHTVRNTTLYFILEPLFICGVNLFFLISGWFGIRFSLKSLARLLCTVLFFIVFNIMACILAGSEIGWKLFGDTFLFPVSRGGYWFIMVYMALMILAPLLNAGIRALDRRDFLSFVVILSVFNIYSCSVGNNYVSFNGYTIMQAVWLYCVAAALRRYKARLTKIKSRMYLGAALVCIAIGSLVLTISRDMEYMDYNSVFVVLPSLFIFLYFTGLKLKNRFVNAVAPAAFGCYLVQDGLFGRRVMYGWTESVYRHIMHDCGPVVGPVRVCMFLLTMLIGIWGVSLLLTPVSRIFGSVVIRLLVGIWNRMRLLPPFARWQN